MARIVFLDRGTIGPQVEVIRPAGAHDWVEYPQTGEDQAIERLRGASVAVTNKVPLRRSTLEQLPDLRFISVAATGYDVIDIEACRALGITVSNVRGYAVNSVPEHVMAMILSLKRQLAGYRADVLAGGMGALGAVLLLHPSDRGSRGEDLGDHRGRLDWPVGRATRAGLRDAGDLCGAQR